MRKHDQVNCGQDCLAEEGSPRRLLFVCSGVRHCQSVVAVTIALSQIVDLHVSSSGSEAVDVVVDAIMRVYADESKFEFKGRRESVEITLGLLSAIAVLAKCDVGHCISSGASRIIVQCIELSSRAMR